MVVVGAVLVTALGCGKHDDGAGEWQYRINTNLGSTVMHSPITLIEELAQITPFELEVKGSDGPLRDVMESELRAAGLTEHGSVWVDIRMPAAVSGDGTVNVDVHYRCLYHSAGLRYSGGGHITGTVDYTSTGDIAQLYGTTMGKYLAAAIIQQIRRDVPNPTTPTKPTPITQVGAGLHHRCTLHDDGTVRCWAGETKHVGGVPMAIVGIAHAVELSVGDSFGCARLADGTVRCWDEATFGAGYYSHPVCGVDHVASLARSTPSCAIRDDHSVVCWSAKDFLEDCTSPVPTTKLVTIPNLHATVLASSAFHTCAADANHDVSCWPPCGDTCLDADQIVRTPIKELAGATDLATNGVICGITQPDTVRCAYLDGAGESRTYSIPGVTKISNGFGFGFGVTSNHELYTWSGASDTATLLAVPNVTDASAALQGGCVLASGAVSCRGDQGAPSKIAFWP